jgi:hypothetical protein
MFVLRHAPIGRSMMHIHTPNAPAVRSAKAAAQSLFVVLIVLAATRAPLAADCLEQPNLQTAQDGRWYYWRDTLNHRKCFYLQQQTRSMETSTAQSKTVADGSVGLSSFLSSLFHSRLSFGSAAPPQQDAAIVATAPAPGAEPGSAKSSPSPSHEGRRFALRSKRAEAPTQADQKKSVREQQYLDPARREALFQEFLRWAAWQDQLEVSGGQ